LACPSSALSCRTWTESSAVGATLGRGGLCGSDTGGGALRAAVASALGVGNGFASDEEPTGGVDKLAFGVDAAVVGATLLGRPGGTGAVERAVGGVEDGDRDSGGWLGLGLLVSVGGRGGVGRMLGGCGRSGGACGGVDGIGAGGDDDGRGARSVFTAPGGGGRLGSGRDAPGRGTGCTPDDLSGIPGCLSSSFMARLAAIGLGAAPKHSADRSERGP